MDINEFSIACKLINLKLRGFDIPKGLPPSLLASLKLHSTTTPPAIPPLPNPTLVNQPPARPDPPKVSLLTHTTGKNLTNMLQVQPIIAQPLIGTAQPIISAPQSIIPNPPTLINTQPLIMPSLGGVTAPPTGIVQPVNMMGVGVTGVTIPTGIVPPMPTTMAPIGGFTPVIPSGPISPVGSVGSVGVPVPAATSTPRASVTSLERVGSIDSGM